MSGFGNGRNLVLGLNGLISLCAACSVICAFVTAGTKFTGGGKLDDAAGFVAVTTALLLVLVNLLTYFVVLRRKSATGMSYIAACTHVMILLQASIRVPGSGPNADRARRRAQLNTAVLFGGLNDVHSEGIYRANIAFSAILFVLYVRGRSPAASRPARAPSWAQRRP